MSWEQEVPKEGWIGINSAQDLQNTKHSTSSLPFKRTLGHSRYPWLLSESKRMVQLTLFRSSQSIQQEVKSNNNNKTLKHKIRIPENLHVHI